MFFTNLEGNWFYSILLVRSNFKILLKNECRDPIFLIRFSELNFCDNIHTDNCIVSWRRTLLPAEYARVSHEIRLRFMCSCTFFYALRRTAQIFLCCSPATFFYSSNKKVKQWRYRPGVAQRVPES